jgi:sulfoxide reductase heme-binding subunit YedZ
MTEIADATTGDPSGALAPPRGPARPRRRPIGVPWRDGRGNLAPLKIAALVLVALPALDFVHTALTVGLEPWPIKRAIRFTGEWSTWFLFLTLAVSPARRILNWSRLIAVRRIVGLAALAYGVAHLIAYAFDVGFNWAFVASETIDRLYLTVGFVALAGLATLGWTSTDGWIRRLGHGWNRLHRLVYPLAGLVFLHILLVRFDTLTFAYLTWLLGYRLMRRIGLPTDALGLMLLALSVFVAALGAELLWTATMTHVDPWRLLAADFDPVYGAQRPVWKVLALGLAVVVIYAARRLPQLVDRKKTRPAQRATALGLSE